MMYIENIFICIAVPMLLSLLFIPGEARKYTFFVTTGMGEARFQELLLQLR